MSVVPSTNRLENSDKKIEKLYELQGDIVVGDLLWITYFVCDK